MNRTHPSSEPEVEEQASLWAARLDGSTLSPSERAELEAWLAGDSARGELLSRYRDLSSDLAEVLPALAAAGAVESPSREGRASRRAWSPGWFAAAALACAVVAAAVWYGMPRPRPESIATASAQRGSFTLSDGTMVELNANTSAQFQNGRSERRIRLAEGEAYFVVTKDKERPFIVETPAGTVRVTGTVFNVRAASSELEVTVVEGTVRVRPGGPDAEESEAKVLVAGDQLTSLAGTAVVRALSAGAVDDALAWRRGLIVCKGMPLTEAVARFARYNGLRITVTPGAASQTAGGIGGIFGIDDPGSFYEDLGTMYHLRVSRGPDGSARVSSATEP
jgi:transmembrane sensor